MARELPPAFRTALEARDYTGMGTALPTAAFCARVAKRCGDLSKRLLAVGAAVRDNKVSEGLAASGIASTVSGWVDSATSAASAAWSAVGNKVDAVAQWLRSGWGSSGSSGGSSSGGGTSGGSASPPAAPAIPSAAHVSVPWFSQFAAGNGYTPGDVSCFAASVAMAQTVKGVTVLGPDKRIQVALSEDASGGITADKAKAAEGVAYIVSELLAGRAVVVGVSHKNPSSTGGRNYNADKITDHFVCITGFGTDGSGRFFTFHEPGTSHAQWGPDTVPTNRFRVDAATSMLVRNGTVATGSTYHRRLQVSMVRTNAVAKG